VAVYDILDVLPQTQDIIIMKLREKKLNFTMQQLCQALLELELKGYTIRENGQYRKTTK
jgi:predicted Rossmann fold nucleotide-binding protein DprA/Smf involved in DNA uptake